MPPKPKMTEAMTDRALALKDEGKSYREIAAAMESEFGVKIAHSGVNTAMDKRTAAVVATAPIAEVAPAARGIVDISFSAIHASPLNPRKTFDAAALAELSVSIAKEGLLQNLVVRPHPDKPGDFEIAAGERRWRAVGLIADGTTAAGPGFDAMALPCRVKEMDDMELLTVAMTENVDREDMPPLEEAGGFRNLADKLIEACLARHRKEACQLIAGRLGFTGRHVELRIALLEKLCPAAQEALGTAAITLAQARALTTGVRLLSEETVNLQLEALTEIENDWNPTAAEVKEHMAGNMPPLGWAVFDVADYDGEIVRDDDNDDPDAGWFCDIGQAQKLQKAAIKTLAAKYQADGAAFVEVLYKNKGEWFQSWAYEEQKSLDGGVVIVVDHQFGVIIHDNLIKKGAAEETGAAKGSADTTGRRPRKSAVEAITKAHMFHARRRKSEVMQRAVANDFGAAMRLLCLALIGGTDAVAINANSHSADDEVLAAEIETAVGCYREDFGVENGGGSIGPLRIERWDTEAQIATWETLQGIDGEALENLFANLVAARVGSFNSFNGDPGDDPVALAIAHTLGLPGREISLGLGLSGIINANDLDGLQNSALEAIAADVGVAPSKTGTATRAAIREAGNGVYVPPTLRFGSPDEIAGLLTAADEKYTENQAEG